MLSHPKNARNVASRVSPEHEKFWKTGTEKVPSGCWVAVVPMRNQCMHAVMLTVHWDVVSCQRRGKERSIEEVKSSLSFDTTEHEKKKGEEERNRKMTAIHQARATHNAKACKSGN